MELPDYYPYLGPEDIYPFDHWDWMVEPIGLDPHAHDFWGWLINAGWVPPEDFPNIETHCGLAREFMLMTERGPRSMEMEDVSAFFHAQQQVLEPMFAYVMAPWALDSGTDVFDAAYEWPGVDKNIVRGNIFAYLQYMKDITEILQGNAWDIVNTPAAHVETGLYLNNLLDVMESGVLSEYEPAAAVADSLRVHLTNNCDLDLAAQAESWADEEYHQCFRLAFQIVVYASHRVMSSEPRTYELSAEQHMNYLGAIGLADNEHNYGSYDQALTLIKDIYLDLSSNFIHVEPDGATEGDVCRIPGNWPPAFTLFLEST